MIRAIINKFRTFKCKWLLHYRLYLQSKHAVPFLRRFEIFIWTISETKSLKKWQKCKGKCFYVRTRKTNVQWKKNESEYYSRIIQIGCTRYWVDLEEFYTYLTPKYRSMISTYNSYFDIIHYSQKINADHFRGCNQ